MASQTSLHTFDCLLDLAVSVVEDQI